MTMAGSDGWQTGAEGVRCWAKSNYHKLAGWGRGVGSLLIGVA